MSAIETAFHGLRRMISSGRLGAGERFPPEADLCIELGVSRGSLREAVRMLAALGVVQPRHGSGVYVSPLRPEDLIGSLALTVELLPLDGLLDLYEIRRVLESHAASRAAGHLGAEEGEALTALLTRMDETEDAEDLSALDAQFHGTIAEASGNPTLVAFLDVLRGRSQAYRLYDVGGVDVRKLSADGHRQILDAILKGDAALAAAVAASHVALTEGLLREHRPQPHPARESGDTSSSPTS